ncbi:MAG: threonine synthase [Gemmatimonadaceae bacterium]
MTQTLRAAPNELLPLAAPDPSSGPRPLPLACVHCNQRWAPAPQALCPGCLRPLVPVYDPARALPSRAELSARPGTLWRYAEWLPFEGPPALATEVGFTPLIEAPLLARELGVAQAWIKNDAVSFPSLSFKDRVVATALNAARAFGLTTVGCASTGNLANAVAAAAARAQLPAWIFIPGDLEPAKIVGTTVYGPKLVRVRGTYDDVNRLCVQVADRFSWGIVNVNLRAYYGEGSKTMGFEIVDQLGWRFPSAVVAPMAGGSLLSKLGAAFAQCAAADLAQGPWPRLYGAQASGCAPIVRFVHSGAAGLTPERPNTIARSLAIGNPADAHTARAAITETGGWAAAVSDDAIVRGIRLLAETTGIFTETAGGVTLAAALALAHEGRLTSSDEVVLCITGNGLKTTDAVAHSLPVAPEIPARLAAVEALLADAAAERIRKNA